MEDNESDVLLIFRSPGCEEWREKRPIYSDEQDSSHTGAVMRNAFERLGKKREDFNITNAVQCYPGQSNNGQDCPPEPLAVEHCSNWLKKDIKLKKYQKIIVFGKETACSVCSIKKMGISYYPWFKFLRLRPSNKELDRALRECEET